MSNFPTKTLLSIDDEESILFIIQAGLSMTTGWRVLTATSGEDGLIKAQNNRLDAIILDAQMPNMDGIATLHQLRKHPETQRIPVVFLTATPQRIAYIQEEDLGVRGILAKPFDPITLAHQVANTLGWQP